MTGTILLNCTKFRHGDTEVDIKLHNTRIHVDRIHTTDVLPEPACPAENVLKEPSGC